MLATLRNYTIAAIIAPAFICFIYYPCLFITSTGMAECMEDMSTQTQIVIGVGIAVAIFAIIMFAGLKVASDTSKANLLEQKKFNKNLQVTKIEGAMSFEVTRSQVSEQQIKEIILQRLGCTEDDISKDDLNLDIQSITESVKTEISADLRIVTFKVNNLDEDYSGCKVIRCAITNSEPTDKSSLTLTEKALLHVELYSIKCSNSSNISREDAKMLIRDAVLEHLMKTEMPRISNANHAL